MGRGCLAGHVYAGAVILNKLENKSMYRDSKTLSGVRREELRLRIKSYNQHGIGFASVEEIDRLNILKASLLAMKRAVLALGVKSGHILVDGIYPIPDMPGFHQSCLIKGDQRAAPIAAASILAKVERDWYISELGKDYPLYGFEQHKGYCTAAHKEAIRKYGPCPVHRRSFSGVKEYLAPPLS